MPVPKYRLAYYRAFNTLVRNMTVWNSAENPRCAPMPAIHYGPKLFCLQGGTGNGYTDTQPLCNLRNVTLLGPGQLRLTFFDKAPVLFNSTLTGNQPYWDPYQALKNPVTYNATGRVFVNFTASTWYDNSTGFDQRYDFYQDKIVALMPGGDAHNWARNKYVLALFVCVRVCVACTVWCGCAWRGLHCMVCACVACVLALRSRPLAMRLRPSVGRAARFRC